MLQSTETFQLLYSSNRQYLNDEIPTENGTVPAELRSAIWLTDLEYCETKIQLYHKHFNLL